MNPPPTKRLAAVIVNHNQNGETDRQLQEYRRDDAALFEAIEWVVVHNGAGPPPGLATEWSAAVQALSAPNRGYGAAINLALATTTAPVLLALNADLLPLPGFLAKSLDAAEAMLCEDAGKPIAIVGCRLFDDDGRPQGSFGPWPNLVRLLAGLFRPRALRKYWTTDLEHGRDVPWATGACMLLRRDFMQQSGGFDERFFMYYEDVDLCLRAWRSGWRVRYQPEPTARHTQPYHSRGLTYEMARLARRSLLVYFWKHRPRWEFHFVYWLVRCECWFRRRDPGWRGVADVVRRARANPEEISQSPP